MATSPTTTPPISTISTSNPIPQVTVTPQPQTSQNISLLGGVLTSGQQPIAQPAKEQTVLSSDKTAAIQQTKDTLTTASDKGLRTDTAGNILHADNTLYKPNESVYNNPEYTKSPQQDIASVAGGVATAGDFGRDNLGNVVNIRTGQIVQIAEPKPTVTIPGTPTTKPLPVPTPSFDSNSPDYYLNPNSPSYQPNYAIENYQLTPEYLKVQKDAADYKAQTDAEGAREIDNVTAQYKVFMDMQKQVNASLEATREMAMIRSGTSRYAPLSAGSTMSATMNYGIQQLLDIEAKKNTAINDIRKAIRIEDHQTAQELATAVKGYQDKRDNVLQKMQENLDDVKKEANKALVQANKDTAIGKIMQTGVTSEVALTDPSLKGLGITAKDIKEYNDNLSPDSKIIADLMKTAREMGAPLDVLANIGKSRDLNSAYIAAGIYGAGGTGIIGEYNIAKTQGFKGTLADFKAADEYTKAAADARAKEVMTTSDPVQQRLMKQYQANAFKTLNARTGDLGIQNAKVSQALHIRQVFDQYKNPITGEYNIPPAQYSEITLGIANLLSTTGQAAESTIKSITTATAEGDFAKVATYATGIPITGSSQEVFQQLKDTLDRQAFTAESLRETYIQNLRNSADPGLSEERKAQVESTMNLPSYVDPSKNAMTPAMVAEQDKQNVLSWVGMNPTSPYIAPISSLESTGKGYTEIKEYLKAKGITI